jgi:hypothetical protein
VDTVADTLENIFKPVAKLGDNVLFSGDTPDDKHSSASEVEADAMNIDDAEDKRDKMRHTKLMY